RVLQSAEWVRRLGVLIEDTAFAEANEDEFDACITAAALLRCVLEEDRLCPARLYCAHAEGGILGSSGGNLQLPERTFALQVHESPGPTAHRTGRSDAREVPRIHRCPIEGCDKVYQGTRGGWDAHVGSNRVHPLWHPEITSAEARKTQFEMEFPDF